MIREAKGKLSMCHLAAFSVLLFPVVFPCEVVRSQEVGSVDIDKAATERRSKSHAVSAIERKLTAPPSTDTRDQFVLRVKAFVQTSIKGNMLEIMTSSRGSQERVRSYDDTWTVRQLWKRVEPTIEN